MRRGQIVSNGFTDMQTLRLRRLIWLLPFLMAMPPIAAAQQFQAPTRAEATAALSPAAPSYNKRQLDQMLAPIALYPDQLLMQILMAATFPQQVLDANQWLGDPQNAALKGDDLVAALQPLGWDASVKSLVAFPQIVAMMSGHMDWTQALGVAFANQQVEMMARVQFLRDRALAAGRLRSSPQLRVERRDEQVFIEPADPDTAYVPVYNPAEIYGAWPDPEYPPVYIPPPRGFVAGEIGAGLGFSVGVGIVGPLWGWGHPDWRRHEIVVDQRRYTNITSTPGNTVTIQNNTPTPEGNTLTPVSVNTPATGTTWFLLNRGWMVQSDGNVYLNFSSATGATIEAIDMGA